MFYKEKRKKCWELLEIGLLERNVPQKQKGEEVKLTFFKYYNPIVFPHFEGRRKSKQMVGSKDVDDHVSKMAT